MNFAYCISTADAKVAASLARKMAEQGKPGAIILLTEEEMALLQNNNQFTTIEVPTKPSMPKEESDYEKAKRERWQPFASRTSPGVTHCKKHDTYFELDRDEPCWQCYHEFGGGNR